MIAKHLKNWSSAHFGVAGVHSVPPRPGVYAVLAVPRTLGLPQSVDALYIGRTLNLRRRLC